MVQMEAVVVVVMASEGKPTTFARKNKDVKQIGLVGKNRQNFKPHKITKILYYILCRKCTTHMKHIMLGVCCVCNKIVYTILAIYSNQIIKQCVKCVLLNMFHI